MSDIIEELDRWLADMRDHGTHTGADYAVLQHARDEIAALRGGHYLLAKMTARAEALEGAARLAIEFMPYAQPIAEPLAAAIRALKDKA